MCSMMEDLTCIARTGRIPSELRDREPEVCSQWQILLQCRFADIAGNIAFPSEILLDHIACFLCNHDNRSTRMASHRRRENTRIRNPQPLHTIYSQLLIHNSPRILLRPHLHRPHRMIDRLRRTPYRLQDFRIVHLGHLRGQIPRREGGFERRRLHDGTC